MFRSLCRTSQFIALAAFLMGTLPARAQDPAVQSSDFSVTTADRVSIHVHRKIGENPAKVPVLLIHGTWCDGRVWDLPGRSVMDYLAVRGYDVYALDLRGMGQSVYSASFSSVDLVSRLQDAIAVAGYIVTNTGRSPVVFGWSEGGVITGMLASYAAAHAPQLVAGVGLFSTGAGPFVVPAPFQPLVGELQVLVGRGVFTFPLTPDQFSALLFSTDPITGKPTMSPDAFAALATLEFASPQQSQPDAILAIGEEINPGFFDVMQNPLAPVWGTIQVPALVVDGALDPLVGADNAQALFDALGSARKQVIVFPRNSHGWFLEDDFASTQRVFNKFLAQFN